MAFLKHANARVVHPLVTGQQWGRIRKASATSSRDLTEQAREILGGSLDMDKYLFTHCTIVASVDVESVPNVKLGMVKVGSETVNRRWADYYIKPSCSQYVNNNGDSWSREVLKMAYPTFIGADNFQEHVQIKEQSKGRILDAVARDIGDSLYIDILVATDRKHTQLIEDITSGKLGTLSMGCSTVHTTCTFCGNVAIDETQLCEHIRYSKLNTFLDDSGTKRIIAELCGHPTEKSDSQAPGGVRFIEASWVQVPAFTGAVMRNILSPDQVSQEQARKVLSSLPSEWSNEFRFKAAKTVKAFEFGEEGGEGGEGEQPAAAEAPQEPFKDIEDALYDTLKTRVRDRIEREIAQKNTQEEPPPAMGPNDSVIKEASMKRYAASLNALVKAASSPKTLVEGVARINEAYGVQIPKSLYRLALSVGLPNRYNTPNQYLTAIRKTAGRELKSAEIRVVVRVGSLLAAWKASHNNPTTTSH